MLRTGVALRARAQICPDRSLQRPASFLPAAAARAAAGDAAAGRRALLRAVRGRSARVSAAAAGDGKALVYPETEAPPPDCKVGFEESYGAREWRPCCLRADRSALSDRVQKPLSGISLPDKVRASSAPTVLVSDSADELKREIERLQRENAALEAAIATVSVRCTPECLHPLLGAPRCSVCIQQEHQATHLRRSDTLMHAKCCRAEFSMADFGNHSPRGPQGELEPVKPLVAASAQAGPPPSAASPAGQVVDVVPQGVEQVRSPSRSFLLNPASLAQGGWRRAHAQPPGPLAPARRRRRHAWPSNQKGSRHQRPWGPRAAVCNL